MANLTPTQTKALQLLDEEFRTEDKVYATWINGATVSEPTMKALAKKGYLRLSNTETVKCRVKGNFGRSISYTKFKTETYYVRVLNFKGELV